jgi:hypothetical protein
MHRSIPLVLASCVLVAACGDGDSSATSTTTASAGSGGAGAAGGSIDTGGSGAAGGAGGQGGFGAGGSATLSLGSVSEDGGCMVPAQAPPGTMCQSLTVSCPEVPDEGLQLLITPASVVGKGTVVLGTGGLGTGFYDSQVVDQLVAAGFRVVNRAWASGWENGEPGGMARAACRYATLLDWLHDSMDASEPLCVSGNSGGSVEISYALSRYGLESILDLAVPTGGPPMGRLDHGCLGGDSWLADCASLTEATTCAGMTACTYNDNQRGIIDAAYAGTPCADADASLAATWLDDSVASPAADYDYASPVRFIFGTQDCTIALSLGLVFANAITSDSSIQFVDAPHATFSTAAGRAAIVSTLDSECAP